jgi:transcriptional regulator with XRE-family HTH domain
MDAISHLQSKLAAIGKIRWMAAKLARAAGVEPSTVSDWQHRRCLPAYDKLDAIAPVFGMTVGELFMASQEESSGRAVPLLVSSMKGTVRDAINPSQTRSSSDRASLLHIARVVIDQLDEAGRIEVFVDALPTTPRLTRRGPRGRRRHRTDDSGSAGAVRGKTA